MVSFFLTGCFKKDLKKTACLFIKSTYVEEVQPFFFKLAGWTFKGVYPYAKDATFISYAPTTGYLQERDVTSVIASF